MKFKFKPTISKDREATKEEIDCIKKTEEMLEKEQKLPPASQQIRDLATTHWKSLKAWIKGSQVIAPQELAEQRLSTIEAKLDALVKHLGVRDIPTPTVQSPQRPKPPQQQKGSVGPPPTNKKRKPKRKRKGRK